MKIPQMNEVQSDYSTEDSNERRWIGVTGDGTSNEAITVSLVEYISSKTPESIPTGDSTYNTAKAHGSNIVVCGTFDTNNFHQLSYTFTATREIIVEEENNLIEAGIEKIPSTYRVENPEEIKEFLEENTILYEILKIAPEKIKVYFPNSTLYLEIDSDREIESMRKLILTIKSDKALEEGKGILDSFYDDWWFDTSLKTKAKMCIFYK